MNTHPDSGFAYDDFTALFRGQTVMAILRGMGVERTVRLAEAVWDAGLRCVEVTIQTPEDVLALRSVSDLARERGALVAAGTVITTDQVTEAVDSGASFLVSPGLDRRVVEAARHERIPVMPGVATPTEVQAALALDLRWLKAFPAAWLGTQWFSHLRGPFPDVQFVATGGLHVGNAPEFLRAGARVVALGSALEDPAQLEAIPGMLAQSEAEVAGRGRSADRD
jgi:2-dehydro-3-deoxyphosphogluconate aldolase / (4S)-4-hydroxy-2-oxoglutarate aldolase